MKGTRVDRWKPLRFSMMFCFLACVVLGSSLRADDDEISPYSRRILQAAPLSTPPVVDGDISDEVWSEAAVGETFTDRQDGKVVADQTRLWLAYDNGNVYVAAYCFDSRATTI